MSGTGGAFVALGLEDGGDADVQGAEDAGDLGDDAGAVLDAEAQVIFGDDLIDRLAGAVEAVGHEAVVAARGLKGGGGFGEVGDDGTGGGVLAGAAAVEEGVADDVAVDGEGVEDAVDGGEDVFLGDERGMDAHFDFAAGVGLDNAEELDRVAEGFGEANVATGDLVDAFDEYLIRRNPETIGERGENDGLVRGVPAVHVERGVGFGVAFRLEPRRALQ